MVTYILNYQPCLSEYTAPELTIYLKFSINIKIRVYFCATTTDNVSELSQMLVKGLSCMLILCNSFWWLLAVILVTFGQCMIPIWMMPCFQIITNSLYFNILLIISGFCLYWWRLGIWKTTIIPWALVVYGKIVQTNESGEWRIPTGEKAMTCL